MMKKDGHFTETRSVSWWEPDRHDVRSVPLVMGRDVKTIGKHIANALKEELNEPFDSVVAKLATTQMADRGCHKTGIDGI